MDVTGSSPDGRATYPYEAELTPKEFDDRPYVYAATRPECDCILAVQPLWPMKPAGVVLAEWAKAGWLINTIAKARIRIGVCTHDFSDAEETGPLVYVAKLKCGCVVGLWKFGVGDKSVGNVLKIWGELGYFVQTTNPDNVIITAECPHEAPKLEQASLFGNGKNGSNASPLYNPATV